MRDFLEQLSTWIHDLLHWVESLAHHPQAGGVLFALAFAESSFFPIPPDVLLIPLCLGDPSKALWFALLCSVGSVLGGMAGYGIGYWGGRPLLYKLFSDAKIQSVERYFDRWNAWATGIAGLTPIPYKVFTISGGAFAINFKVFVIASILARSLRFFTVAGLIYVYGEPIQAFIDKYLNLLSVAFVVLLVAGFLLIGKGLGRATEDAEEAEELSEAAEPDAAEPDAAEPDAADPDAVEAEAEARER